jgi:hypothetical protein
MKGKFMENMKARIGHDWKNIYRQCVATDGNRKGTISINRFNLALLQFKVHLTKDELRRIAILTRDDEGNSHSPPKTANAGEISYTKLSKKFGLHHNSLDSITQSPSAMCDQDGVS